MSQEADALQVFDEETALARLEDDPSLVAEILAMFRECAIELLADLERAIARGSAVEVRGVAHALRGAAGAICADRIHALCTVLEERAMANDSAVFANHLAELKREYAAFEEAAAKSKVAQYGAGGS